MRRFAPLEHAVIADDADLAVAQRIARCGRLPCLGHRRIAPVVASEGAGGLVLSGICFYQSYAREIAEAKGWKRLATNSAKLVNILGGYGYRPMIASMEACVDAAVSGRLA